MKTWLVEMQGGNAPAFEADGFRVDDGCLIFYAGEGVSKATVAAFAKSEWRRAAPALTPGEGPTA